MYRHLQWKVFLLISVILTGSCGLPAPTPVAPVTDEELSVAVEEAHSTLNVVRHALLSPKPSYVFIGLKIRVHGDEEYEDIWTEPVDYYDGAFTTQMVEGVNIEMGYHPENLVRVPVDDILEWMIMEEDGNSQKKVKMAQSPARKRTEAFLGEQADIQAFILKRYPTPSSVRI